MDVEEADGVTQSVDDIYQSMDQSKLVVDRDDIAVGDASIAPFAVKHIQRLLQIRAAHKAPKALITDMLKYIHQEFKGVDGIHELPTTWQQCERAIQDVKPKFVKVTNPNMQDVCCKLDHIFQLD